MNKKILNDLLILLYPLLLLFGVWRHWLLLDKAARMYQIPYVQLILLILIFFLLLGAFTYYFLVLDSEFHFPVLIIGAIELVVLSIPRISGNVYTVISGKYLVFGTVLTLYLVLIIKRCLKR